MCLLVVTMRYYLGINETWLAPYLQPPKLTVGTVTFLVGFFLLSALTSRSFNLARRRVWLMRTFIRLELQVFDVHAFSFFRVICMYKCVGGVSV